MQVYRRGDRGPAVSEIRSRLARLRLLPDTVGSEVFDADVDAAVRAFQQARGLAVDGLVGAETYRALEEARWRLGDRVLSYRASVPYVGDDVAALQQRLLDMGYDPGRCDGVFGPRTDAALRELQSDLGQPVDGLCGPRTWRALAQLTRTVTGGSPEGMREELRYGSPGPLLSARVVVIDPGHGGPDRGAQGGGLDEAAVVEDLAARVEGRLGATGVTAYLTRGPDGCPTEEDRAGFANEAQADLFVSLHVDKASSERCNGVATYYYGAGSFGGRATGSGLGQRLAALIQREIVARTDLLDCRSHPKTWTLLRLTRMPAVRVEAGYLTNRSDASRLASSEFLDAVADGVVAGLQRLYLPADLDVPTGQLRIPVTRP